MNGGNNVKKAFLYSRVASHENCEETLNIQQKNLIDYAKSNDYKIVESISEVQSGRNINRSGIASIMASAKLGLFDTLILTNIARIGRDINQVGKLLTKLKNLGIEVISLDSISENRKELRAVIYCRVGNENQIN